MAGRRKGDHDRGKQPLQVQLRTQECDQIERTLGRVEIGLRRHCAEECHAGIDEHFQDSPPVTWQSNVAELVELGPRIINALQSHDINTAAELKKAVWDGRAIAIRNFGPKELQRCLRALDAIGQQVLDWVI
ncbi:MAG: hypothetical protein L0Z53_13075 [Acidobacteriales bacterium]|nr:hypothetical protein [Terriglobales bacterium]